MRFSDIQLVARVRIAIAMTDPVEEAQGRCQLSRRKSVPT